MKNQILKLSRKKKCCNLALKSQITAVKIKAMEKEVAALVDDAKLRSWIQNKLLSLYDN